MNFVLDTSHVGRVCRQLTELTLVIDEIIGSEHISNIDVNSFAFFENLKYLSIVSLSINGYPPLSIARQNLTFSSSKLVKLDIKVKCFDDVLALLDGRLKQLTTLTVEVSMIYRRGNRLFSQVSLQYLLN